MTLVYHCEPVRAETVLCWINTLGTNLNSLRLYAPQGVEKVLVFLMNRNNNVVTRLDLRSYARMCYNNRVVKNWCALNDSIFKI